MLCGMLGQSLRFDQHRTMGLRGETSSYFLAENVVSLEHAAALMRLAPANPFCTRSYAEAMRAKGYQPWLLGTERERKLVAGCYAFITSGGLNRALQIPSLPDLAYHDFFWGGLLGFCSSHHVTCLELNSFASSGARIPALPGEVERQERCEYVLDLGDPQWGRNVARKHRYSIRKALRAGVTMRKATSHDACRDHGRVMATSRERRRKRGESIPGSVEDVWSWCLLLIEKGAGELFQAVAGGKVLSSVMVLRAAEGAYGETGGTSPEGMECGASHFLHYSIARVLREESVRAFNLGGAELNPGLALFNRHFGATPVPLEAGTFYLGSGLRRKLTEAVRFLRQRGASLADWPWRSCFQVARRRSCPL